MREYQFSLNVTIQAHDDQEAIEIAKAIQAAAYVNPYKCDIEVDTVEEA